MCICVNCYYMTGCKVYQAIENFHLIKTNKIDCQFEPRNVQIKVRVNAKSEIGTDWDVTRCSSFITDTGKFVILNKK
uniref:Uncharacterized protein n=1 Tax=Glaucocystis sp. BBH TaxID=2023628 RepID=A0A3G1IV40_9EUKA|nr:hypothetical protein Ycf34 [Glaucocystis sp. BBH]